MPETRILTGQALSGLLALCLTLVALSWAIDNARAQQNRLPVTFERTEISVETTSGMRHLFQVELAVTREQFGQGLMFRRELAEDAGMLFILPRPQTISMWMKDTYLPLDMLFLDSKGQIVKLVERTIPLSADTIPSNRPVKGILEVNGGTAARLGLAVGDRVMHPAFDQPG